MFIQILLLLVGLLFFFFVIKPLIPMIKLKLQFGSYCRIQFSFQGILGFNNTYNRENNLKKLVNKNAKFIVQNCASSIEITIIDPDYYQYVLINHENYSKINELNTNQLFDEGILFQQGDKWKQQRELYSQHFDVSKLKISLPNINQIIEKHIIQYDEQKENTYEMMSKIISEIIVFSFFGVDADKLQINSKSIGLETINLFQSLLNLKNQPYQLIKRILFGVQAIKMFPNQQEQIIQTKINNIKLVIEKIIQKRIVQHELKLDEDENEISQISEDFLNVYIDAYLQSKKQKNKISIEEIKQQFFTYLSVGYNSTTQIINKSLSYLAEQQDIQSELRKEILKSDKSQIIELQQLNNLVLLNAYFNEVLRLNSFAPIIKKVQTTHFIKDLKLEKDYVIRIDNSLTNSLDKYYDDANQFNHQRWFQTQSIKENNSQVFIPFSFGPRNCIGQNLANVIYKLVIVNIISNFQITKAQKQKNSLVDQQIAFVKLTSITQN